MMFYPIFFPMGRSSYNGPPPTLRDFLVGIPIVLLIIAHGCLFMFATFMWISDPFCSKYSGDGDGMDCIVIERYGPKPSLVECYHAALICEWRLLKRVF